MRLHFLAFLLFISLPLHALPDKAVVYIKCVDSNGLEVSSGTGAVISEFGDILTAKHIIDEARTTQGSLCTGKLKSKFAGAANELDISSDVSQSQAAIVKFKGNVELPKILKYCNSSKYQLAKSYRGEFDIYGFPEKVDLNRWSVRALGFNGPSSTWYIDANLLKGFSGGPVLDVDENIIGIALGGSGSGFESSDFRSILPERAFSSLLSGRAEKCGSWDEPVQEVLSNTQLSRLMGKSNVEIINVKSAEWQCHDIAEGVSRIFCSLQKNIELSDETLILGITQGHYIIKKNPRSVGFGLKLMAKALKGSQTPFELSGIKKAKYASNFWFRSVSDAERKNWKPFTYSETGRLKKGRYSIYIEAGRLATEQGRLEDSFQFNGANLQLILIPVLAGD